MVKRKDAVCLQETLKQDKKNGKGIKKESRCSSQHLYVK